jgi:hypothetical protein
MAVTPMLENSDLSGGNASQYTIGENLLRAFLNILSQKTFANGCQFDIHRFHSDVTSLIGADASLLAAAAWFSTLDRGA